MDAVLDFFNVNTAQIEALDTTTLIIVGVISALVLILYVALIVCIFATASRTRKIKKMDKKINELIAINQVLLTELQKKNEQPAPPVMFPIPQPPHPGSSWRRR